MFAALSGLLFFGFIIKKVFLNQSTSWNNEEQRFVLSWCRVWNLLWLPLLLFIIGVWINSIYVSSFFSSLGIICWYVILVILAISVVFLLSWITFEFREQTQSISDKLQILKSFIPIYSSYQRYNNKQFQAPYWWLKEAQLWYFFIWLACFFSHSWLIAWGLFIIMLLRIFLLLWDKDILTLNQRLYLNQWFMVYPEEIFAFFWAGITYAFKGKNSWISSIQIFRAYQSSYRGEKSLITKLIMIFLILGMSVYLLFEIKGGIYWKVIPILWMFLRYWILWITKTPIPKLPIIAEITSNLSFIK